MHVPQELQLHRRNGFGEGLSPCSSGPHHLCHQALMPSSVGPMILVSLHLLSINDMLWAESLISVSSTLIMLHPCSKLLSKLLPCLGLKSQLLTAWIDALQALVFKPVSVSLPCLSAAPHRTGMLSLTLRLPYIPNSVPPSDMKWPILHASLPSEIPIILYVPAQMSPPSPNLTSLPHPNPQSMRNMSLATLPSSDPGCLSSILSLTWVTDVSCWVGTQLHTVGQTKEQGKGGHGRKRRSDGREEETSSFSCKFASQVDITFLHKHTQHPSDTARCACSSVIPTHFWKQVGLSALQIPESSLSLSGPAPYLHLPQRFWTRGRCGWLSARGSQEDVLFLPVLVAGKELLLLRMEQPYHVTLKSQYTEGLRTMTFTRELSCCPTWSHVLLAWEVPNLPPSGCHLCCHSISWKGLFSSLYCSWQNWPGK